MMITVNLWGNGARKFGLDTVRVRVDPVWGASASVVRSLERRTGLVCCAGPRSEGTALDRHGDPESRHHVCTLGRPVRGGGYCPEGEFWFSIPCA